MQRAQRGPILIVDDEPRVLSGLRRILEDQWELLEASSGDEALDVLLAEPMAIILTDLVMPGMDGLRLLQRVAECSPDTVRILLTGRGDYNVAVRAVNEARAFGFLRKPCQPHELETMLDQAETEHDKRHQRSGAEERVEHLQRSLKGIARLVEQVGIGLGEVTDPVQALPELATLSEREWDVVRLLLKGHRVPNIARALGISTHTVRSHLRRVFQKLEVKSQEELVERLRGVP